MTLPLQSLSLPVAYFPFQTEIWLIGRGPAEQTDPLTAASGTNSQTAKGYVGQVHIFDPRRFSQPRCSFDLDAGFMPTAAVFVDVRAAGETRYRVHAIKRCCY
ncbi:hypothetical protein AHF37_03662 [Paragonimus kellicotti]|nr:hypothetical protein AHF37_03662 [Paragonimus kellicotti]